MKTAILSIGNEVVEGFVTNINATYFAAKLNEVGISVNKHLTITDAREEIKAAIRYLNQDHDLIIVSGGLGPTGDDITKESIAEELGIELKINDYELKKLKEHFKKRKYVYTSVNDKQALFSDIDTVLVNDNGTANGYYFTFNHVKYCVLPGPPVENKVMISDFIKTLVKGELLERDIYLINIGESNAETKMKHLYDKYPDVYIGCYQQDLGLNYRLKAADEKALTECFNELVSIFEENYVCDSANPVQSFVDHLIEHDITISFAESCTAGLACSLIGNIPDASKILNESLVTYSNQAKEKYLNVPSTILSEFGAVSKECSEAMALGLAKQTDSKLCISITGLAGPGGATPTKPVGLVYCTINYNNKLTSFENHFNGNRTLIRQRAAKGIILEAYRLLKCTI